MPFQTDVHRRTSDSDSALSLSSSSSGEIMGTPFDLGAQRFEYPFPQAQGSPTDPFSPLSTTSITPHAHPQLLPPWPIHVSKSFPLTPPPLGRLKAHPKLRSASVREPPVPPGLVKRRSRVQHQSSSEEPSDRSDVCDEIARAQRSLPDRKLPQADEIVPLRHVASLPIGSFDRPALGDPARSAPVAPRPQEGAPRPPVLQRARNASLVRDRLSPFMVYCWTLASQASHWILALLLWLLEGLASRR